LPRKADHEYVRPYCFYNPADKARVPHHFFVYPGRAHDGVLLFCKHHLKPGEAIELINANTGRVLGQYVRGQTSIDFYAGADYAKRRVSTNATAQRGNQAGATQIEKREAERAIAGDFIPARFYQGTADQERPRDNVLPLRKAR
jgi:TRAP-type uncharacterized transport system substrate-binding protein